jgi:hypothetical protein
MNGQKVRCASMRDGTIALNVAFKASDRSAAMLPRARNLWRGQGLATRNGAVQFTRHPVMPGARSEAMRALFSVVGLLTVLAIVALLARKQLQAVAPSAAAAATASAGAAPTVQEQARGVQQKVLQDVNRSLEQGAARASDSQP